MSQNEIYIPSKFLGGHTSQYDRELVDTLGVQKNHISNGRRGGEGVPITIILKSGFPRHLYKGNVGKSPKITVFAYFDSCCAGIIRILGPLYVL